MSNAVRFLAQVSLGLDRRVAALGCEHHGVAELRAFARELAIITGRDATPKTRTLDVGALVMSVTERWAPRFAATVECSAESVVGDYDEAHIESILAELLSNAAKYGRPPIVVGLAAIAGGVRLTVHDRGPGLSRGTRSGRFVRGARSKKQPGFGVGIWLARTLCRAHGGHLRLEYREGLRAIATLRTSAKPLAARV